MRCAIVALALVSTVAAVPVQDDAIGEFERGNHMLTAAIYKELVKLNTGNLVVSPFSVETILSLAYEGARGDTAAELVSGLYLPNTDEKIHAAYKSFLPQLQKTSDGLTFKSANKIYLRKGAILEDKFRSIADVVYGSGVENVDFSMNEAVANEINTWVEDQTNNKIKDLIDPDNISIDTVMVLVNTLYLSGKWAKPFEYYHLMKTFYKTKDNPIITSTMGRQDKLNYLNNQDLNTEFLELPLVGANISMVIVLPKDIDGLVSLEDNIDKILEPQPYVKQVVDVELPSFSIESKIQFIPILEKLGIQRVFGPAADLSGISKTDTDVYITDVFQKAFINVTESGIEAGAVTEISGTRSATLPATTTFKANHPFLYYIQNNGVVLFVGRYVNPEE